MKDIHATMKYIVVQLDCKIFDRRITIKLDSIVKLDSIAASSP